jgi:hypothetical protein
MDGVLYVIQRKEMFKSGRKILGGSKEKYKEVQQSNKFTEYD